MTFNMDDFTWIDAHNHTRFFGERNEVLDRKWSDDLLEAASKLNIEKICISHPLTGSQFVTPGEFREANDNVLKWMKYSDRFWGFCFVNPGWQEAACEEIKRCFDAGMRGIKLYHQYLMNDPAQSAVCELAGSLGMPILMHAGKLTGNTALKQPRISNALHMTKAARLFPDTTFIQAHIGGGGDWEWNLRTLEDSPENLFIDIGGTNIDTGIVRKTVDTMGAKRVLFATDMHFEEGVGKVLDAGLSKAERRLVCRENILNILKRK